MRTHGRSIIVVPHLKRWQELVRLDLKVILDLLKPMHPIDYSSFLYTVYSNIMLRREEGVYNWTKSSIARDLLHRARVFIG